MILIHTPSSTPRLKYIFDLVFKDLIGLDYQLTHDREQFLNSELPKINYSENVIGGELFFFATPLLFERKIHKQDISVFDYEGTKAFFATHPKYMLPFDMFAASFYLVSRYEEYLPHQTDALGRFEIKESLAWQKGFLQKPVLNIWAKKIKGLLAEIYPQLKFEKKKYQFISTIDID